MSLFSELENLGELMADNLEQQGVTASASDGLTTLANKILDIQGGSSYHIELSEHSVTTTGTFTISATLQEDYQLKSGAVITFSGGTSTVTATTDSNGVATATVSFSASGTLTATYGNVSDTCSVTVQSYLFYDDCNSSSGLSNYGSLIQLESSSYQATLGYDSTENAYKVTSIGDAKSKSFPITSLNNADDFTIEADIKRNNSRVGLAISSGTGYGYCISITENTKFEVWKYTNKSWSNQGSTSATITEWVNLKLTIDGLDVSILLTNANGNTYTKTLTLDSRYSNRDFGILSASQSANQYGYIKNIKAEAI